MGPTMAPFRPKVGVQQSHWKARSRRGWPRRTLRPTPKPGVVEMTTRPASKGASWDLRSTGRGVLDPAVSWVHCFSDGGSIANWARCGHIGLQFLTFFMD